MRGKHLHEREISISMQLQIAKFSMEGKEELQKFVDASATKSAAQQSVSQSRVAGFQTVTLNKTPFPPILLPCEGAYETSRISVPVPRKSKR